MFSEELNPEELAMLKNAWGESAFNKIMSNMDAHNDSFNVVNIEDYRK